jgi:hypothetical protein
VLTPPAPHASHAPLPCSPRGKTARTRSRSRERALNVDAPLTAAAVTVPVRLLRASVRASLVGADLPCPDAGPAAALRAIRAGPREPFILPRGVAAEMCRSCRLPPGNGVGQCTSVPPITFGMYVNVSGRCARAPQPTRVRSTQEANRAQPGPQPQRMLRDGEEALQNRAAHAEQRPEPGVQGTRLTGTGGPPPPPPPSTHTSHFAACFSPPHR